ncbi:uncharacterized protein LOC116195006 [Punica granatum]|uniref:Uncharacterized protein LOC116195006 n=2 Tax=Punica granatum TaxID=22663 RepID=A0A6P8CEA1_PUNGR|nr:uncharacterized protein LOC116195006 [Punica granatum]PKI33582.1 hypothetical protein CRG98_046038 [Punica granatum]
MAHSLTPASATIAPFSTGFTRKTRLPSVVLSVRAREAEDQGRPCTLSDDKLVHRRNVGLGLAGALLGMVIGGERHAAAAGRRPPPPPPGEKKDPNVSGVQAKVLASKKRKEAMKEEMAKLRQKGKAIDESPQPKSSD